VSDSGQFSLAGAQPKTALLFDGKRWGVPSGQIPTTHILKPGVAGLEGHAINEHFCLALARELGLPVASSRILHFEDQIAIAVERYDRLRRGDGVVRVHQEDICQALAVHPAHKYENEGGPGARAITALLRENSREPNEDINTFVDALAFGWIVAATDGHAKNYSLLIGAEGKVRLAPLYDVASALPDRGLSMQKLTLAMKIGGKYRVGDIGPYQFRKLAADLELDEEEVLVRTHDMAARLPDQATLLLREMGTEGLSSQVLRRLSDALCARAKRCATELGRLGRHG
jgi:serine/threonine-protein kinase HipA